MFSARELTLACSPNSRDAGFWMASRSAFSSQLSHIYQGLERVTLLLTCGKGDFAEDLSEEGRRTKA
jgi:hypothetical protein